MNERVLSRGLDKMASNRRRKRCWRNGIKAALMSAFGLSLIEDAVRENESPS